MAGGRRHSTRLAALLLAPLLLTGVHTPRIDQVAPGHHEGWLTVSVWSSDLLDERTRSTIESGLPGTCVFEIELERRDGSTVVRRRLDRDLRLDLWRDRYVLRDDDEPQEFRSLAEADSAWSRVDRARLVQWERLDPGAEYRLALSIAVQPLRAEDRGRVAEFVSQSSGERQEFALNLSALLRRWFGRAADTDGDRFATAYFRPRDLREEP